MDMAPAPLIYGHTTSTVDLAGTTPSMTPVTAPLTADPTLALDTTP